MFYLLWQTFTRLEVAIASIYGSSLARASEDDERRFKRRGALGRKNQLPLLL